MAGLKFEKRLNQVENKVTSIETKVDMFIGEMRQQNQMRAAEIREIRASVNGIQNRIEDMGKHVRNLTVAAMVGMGTMTIAGIAITFSIALK